MNWLNLIGGIVIYAAIGFFIIGWIGSKFDVDHREEIHGILAGIFWPIFISYYVLYQCIFKHVYKLGVYLGNIKFEILKRKSLKNEIEHLKSQNCKLSNELADIQNKELYYKRLAESQEKLLFDNGITKVQNHNQISS